jgi:hypothetical protein
LALFDKQVNATSPVHLHLPQDHKLPGMLRAQVAVKAVSAA